MGVKYSNAKIRRSVYKDALEYYQCHSDEFIEDVLGIPLNIYQKLLVRAFFIYNFLVWVLCRGLGKTWLGVLCVVTYCLLNPNTKAGIIAPAFRQAKNAIQEKYKDELCEMSPFLAQEERLYICNTQKARVEWFNGSWLEAYPVGSDGAKIRGARLHVVLIDEAAYVPPYIIDNVVKPMMIVKRGYKVGQDQGDYDGNKCLMVSTASYRFNHLYKLFVEYFNRMIEPGNKLYFAMTMPYTVGIRVGLFDEEIVKQQKQLMTDMEFEMEYLGRFPRLLKDAWVSYDDLQNCSDLEHIELIGYDEFEYLMSIDVAREEGQDNTVIDVFKLHWYNDHIEADLVYTYSMNGQKFEYQAKKVREILKKFPNVKRIYQDTMTIGQGLSDELSKDYYDETEQKWYPPLIDHNNEQAMRSLGQTNGIDIIYGVKATPEINHKMGYAIKTFTQKCWLHMYPFRVEEERDLNLEEKKLVYETESTRMEIMNIQTMGVNNGWVKFGTKSKRKDRWSAMGLGLYGIQELANERFEEQRNKNIMVSIKRRSRR